MSATTQVAGKLHRAMHLIPGVPAHSARALKSSSQREAIADRHAHTNQNKPHVHAVRSPRVMVAWQNRIGALFGQEPR